MVNQWVTRSLEVANSDAHDYLDRVYPVYPSKFNAKREPPNWAAIEAAHTAQDWEAILDECLDLAKFPIEYPYATILKKHRNLVATNPVVAEYIGNQLLATDRDELEIHCSVPKKASTQAGPMFSNWIRLHLGIPLLEEAAFLIHGGPCILQGTDDSRKIFANTHLDAAAQKGLDIVAKNRHGQYAIGEAKFMGISGGNQNTGFRDIRLLAEAQGGVDGLERIGIIDGYVWINTARKPKGKSVRAVVRRSNHNFMSALVLSEYLNQEEPW